MQTAQTGMMEAGGSLRSPRPLANLEDAHLVSQAAHAGEPDAMRLVAMLIARGIGCPSDWNAALAWQVAAAEAGDDDARAELLVLTADDDYRTYLDGLAQNRALPPDAWRRLAAGVKWDRLLGPPVPAIVSTQPLIATARAMVSKVFCAWLITRVRPHLTRAVVLSPDAAHPMVEDTRTNSAVGAPFAACGLPLLAVRERIARLTGFPVANLEVLNILHYGPGEEFTPHYDSFEPDQVVANEGYKEMGQRAGTLLVYLNEGYEEGETEFPRLDWRFRGQTGDALFWRNLLPDGRRDEATLHAGRPPASGEKWILSQWIRENPQPAFT